VAAEYKPDAVFMELDHTMVDLWDNPGILLPAKKRQ
jgi:predicted secreted acid phosphatase